MIKSQRLQQSHWYSWLPSMLI